MTATNTEIDVKRLLQFKPDPHKKGDVGADVVISFLFSQDIQVTKVDHEGHDALLIDAEGSIRTLEIKTFSSGGGYSCAFREGQANADFYAFYSSAVKCIYFATKDDLNISDKTSHERGMNVSVPKAMFTPEKEKESLELLQERLGFRQPSPRTEIQKPKVEPRKEQLNCRLSVAEMEAFNGLRNELNLSTPDLIMSMVKDWSNRKLSSDHKTKYVTLSQAAKITGKSKSTISNALQKGDLEGVKVGDVYQIPLGSLVNRYPEGATRRNDCLNLKVTSQARNIFSDISKNNSVTKAELFETLLLRYLEGHL